MTQPMDAPTFTKRESRSVSDPREYISVGQPDVSLITNLDADEEDPAPTFTPSQRIETNYAIISSGDGDVFIPPQAPPRAMSVGYLYIPTPECSVDTLVEDQEHKEMGLFFLNILWVVVACGYMVAWTSIGSLIVYFKAQYGAFFYVRLYCAFYLPGWPVSALQRKYDASFDLKFGSSTAFMIRVLLGMVVQFAVLVLMPYLPKLLPEDAVENAMIVSMGIIGVASWVCHGTACQLCGMFPPSSVSFLQTGFCAPQVFTIIMVFVLDLDDENAKTRDVNELYQSTAIVVLCGTVCWVALARSSVALKCFTMKDLDSQQLPNRSSTKQSKQTSSKKYLKTPLLNNIEESKQEEEDDDGDTDDDNSIESMNKKLEQFRRNSKNKNDGDDDLDMSNHSSNHGKDSSSSLTQNIDSNQDEEDVDEGRLTENDEDIAKLVKFCRVSIFLNIWCSIFAAAFFVYVPSSNKPIFGSFGGGTLESVEVVLYFVRLFSDLSGRPLAGTFRPRFLASKSSLVKIAAFRIFLMAVFFLYIAVCPEQLRNDFFIILIVAVFSVFSGYLSVLSYEYAAQAPQTKNGQAIACALMNSTFQIACFTAVVTGVIVSEIVSMKIYKKF
mmetsp:Transcript_26378/g.34314  ORF Transcript_26378/g.34314 Transcript_26378/m.34314 type:complete len:611 (+) Transcript_26378:46-1878(+)